MLWIGLIVFILLLTACSSPMLDSSNRGIQQESPITADDIPDEPAKEEITQAISDSTYSQVDNIISSNFPLVDVVREEDTEAEIYATKQFQMEELSAVLTEKIQPDEESEVVDNQQMFIYPDYFVTLKPSEADDDVLLIEVASERFVERNYSPNFLSTYFTIRMLDSLFGNNWSTRRTEACQTGGCYGGYTGKKSSTAVGGSGSGSSNRGSSSYRGGGPSTGK